MKKLFCILFLVCAFNCFGQGETKEDFVNEVYRILVDSSCKYFYLCDTAYCLGESTLSDRPFTFQRSKNRLKEFIPDSIISQFILNISHDTISETWDCSKMKFVRCFHKDVGVRKFDTLYRSLKKQVFEQERERIHDKIVQLPSEEKSLFWVSNPVYDNAKLYCYIVVAKDVTELRQDNTAMEKGKICSYLFKKLQGLWIIDCAVKCDEF
jgi:hypothetical protein